MQLCCICTNDEIMRACEILQRHKLKRTACREGIINLLLQDSMALSEHEIKEHFIGSFDRTTFYRSFKTLLECNIIHKIVIDQQTVKYALDNSFGLRGDHPHFFCEGCKSIWCMENIPVKMPELPKGFESKEMKMLISGSCFNCKILNA